MKAKAVLFHHKKGPPTAQHCLHKPILCKVTKLEVMVLKMHKNDIVSHFKAEGKCALNK